MWQKSVLGSICELPTGFKNDACLVDISSQHAMKKAIAAILFCADYTFTNT